LDGLEKGDIARYLKATTGLDSDRAAAAVYARTEGNPFFIRELVYMLKANA